MGTAQLEGQYSELATLFMPLHGWLPVSGWAIADWATSPGASNGFPLSAPCSPECS